MTSGKVELEVRGLVGADGLAVLGLPLRVRRGLVDLLQALLVGSGLLGNLTSTTGKEVLL